MSPYEAKQFIRNAHDNCIALARSKYPTYTKPSPTVDFDLKGRSVMGKARISTNRVSYNLAYIMVDPVKFLSTVAHEVAHIVGYATGLGKNHSYGWQMIDRSLGGTGERCGESLKDEDGNHLIAKARRTRQYLYRDSKGQEKWIGPKHHKSLQMRPSASLTYKLDRAKVTGADFQGRERMAA